MFYLIIVLFFLGGTVSQSQISDDTRKKREMFLKAREKMQTLPPEPTSPPKPKATPRPKPSPIPTDIPEPTQKPEPQVTPEPTEKPQPTLTPEPTRKPQPTDIPEPTERPRPTRKPEPTDPPKETPQPTSVPFRTPPKDVPEAPITIRKSGSEQTEIVAAPRRWWGGPKWKYITPRVRRGIDKAPVRKGRWKYIVVHNSGTRQGNAKIFDFYHRRTRKMPNGMAYHFVIGNGTSSGDGEIELGSRWLKQINGGHVHSDYLNYISLGICLVGDYNRDKPTRKQLEALDELIRYLRSRCGKVDRKYSIVRAHKEINPVPTDCPGDRFPVVWLHRRFD